MNDTATNNSYQIKGPFDEINQIHFIQRGVMPLVLKTDEAFVPLGTAFVIHQNGLMMTAAHVLREIPKRLGLHATIGAFETSEVELYAIYISDVPNPENPEQFIGGLVPIQKLTYSNDTDIGLVQLTLPIIDGSLVRLTGFQLTLDLPRIGENIVAIGSHSMSFSSDQADPKSDFQFSQKPTFSTGQIKEIYRERRDSVMLPFPSFQANVRFEPGMSGGPVISESGRVCGVICSRLFNDDEQNGYATFVSLIWPAMGISTTFFHSEDGQPLEMTVYELAQRKVISVDETLERVRVVNCVGGQPKIHFCPSH